MARRDLSISGLSLESKYEAIMRFLRKGYRYFALHDTIVGIRPTRKIPAGHMLPDTHYQPSQGAMTTKPLYPGRDSQSITHTP